MHGYTIEGNQEMRKVPSCSIVFLIVVWYVNPLGEEQMVQVERRMRTILRCDATRRPESTGGPTASLSAEAGTGTEGANGL